MSNNNLKDLEKLSANWSPDQWERYLSTLETPCKEVLISPSHYNKLSQTKNISTIFEGLPLLEKKRFKPKLSVKEVMNKLSRNERRVIVGLYWYDLTQDVLAEKFQVSKQSINKYKARALKKMKNFISLNLLDNLDQACTEECEIA